MTPRIYLAIGLAALGAVCAWYVLDLRSDNERLGLELQACQEARRQLLIKIDEQNAAVDGLRKESDERTVAASKALEEANRSVAALDSRVSRLLAANRPAGMSACANAERLLNEELAAPGNGRP